MNVVKFLPPLVMSEADREWMVAAVNDVVADAHRVPGAAWEFGKTLATQATRMNAGAAKHSSVDA